MNKTHQLWYEIADFFAEAHLQCRRIVSWDRAMNARSMMSEELKTRVSMIGAPHSERAESDQDLVLEEFPDGIDLIALRDRMRQGLNELKRHFSRSLTEREVYYALFPIVIHLDELLRIATAGRSDVWEPLQSELYDIDNGGERFYQVLDNLLVQDETHPLVLEIFYYCLSDGFQGQYLGDIDRIVETRARLAVRIPTPGLEERKKSALQTKVQLYAFPWQYYTLAVLAATFIYIACSVFAFTDGGLH